MSGGRNRKFTRDEAESALGYLNQLYGAAPAYLSHYLYLVFV